MSLYDDYRHFAHVPTIRDGVKATLELNGREPVPSDFENVSGPAATELGNVFAVAKAVWSARNGVDPLDSWGVLEELTRMRSRDAARRIFDAEREPAADLDALYLPRSALADLDRGEPLISGVLDRHTLAAISGRDQTYKSFIVVDWLCSLATGLPWLQHPVERSRCLYVVGEGAWGLDDRVSAWEAHQRVSVPDDWLTVRRAPVNLFHGGPALDHLLARIERDGFTVVVFDTLSRSSTGANLDRPADANVVIEAMAAARDATGGAVIFVAHTQRTDEDTRGATTLEDDIDIVWRTKRNDDGAVRLWLAKRKDGPDGLSFTLWPQPEAGSAVMVDQRPEGVIDLDPAPKWTHEILHELRQPALRQGASPTLLAETLHTTKGALTRAFNWLLAHHHVTKSGVRPVVYRAVELPPMVS